MKPTIQGIGTAVPPHKIGQKAHHAVLEAANGISREQRLILRQIYYKSGIDYRYSVLPEFSGDDGSENQVFHPGDEFDPAPVGRRMEIFEEHAVGLALEAAADCFAQLPKFDKKSITHLITFSCTGMYAPGLDIQLVEQLDLERSTERTCINFMGCYAAINALKSANYICKSEQDAVVMLAGVELCSLHYQKSNETNQVIANALFGDGAAVLIVSAKTLREAGNPGLCLRSFYSEFEQSASQEMVWRIGDAGFDLRLTPEVPNVVSTNIKALMDKLFAKTEIDQNDVDFYAIHPGGMKILQACEKALEITPAQNENSYLTLKNYGNMSSVTVLFVLRRYLLNLTSADVGKNILSCAFGPGITMEAMILEVC